MAVDAADLDRDGSDDLVVLDMLSREHRRRLTQRNILRAELAPAGEITGRPQYPRNTLQWNRGDGTYAEVAQFAGVEGTEWSWNPLLLDVDLDGYEDLLVPNGFVRDNMNLDAMNRIAAEKGGRRLSPQDELQLRGFYPPLDTPNLAFRNLGHLRFAECSQAWGFNQAAISQGACLADLDNDGDQDVILNNLNLVAGVYRNDSSAPRVAVRLSGESPNTAGIGARVIVSGGPVAQSQEIVCGGRYCSSDQLQRTFAVGAARSVDVRVRWRSGRESRLTNVAPNQVLELREPPAPRFAGSSTAPAGRGLTGQVGSEPAASVAVPSAARPSVIRFVDLSASIRHQHGETPFDDFDRQPMLPRKLSQLGPGVAWWDLDGDGREDLIVGAGRGQSLAAFRNSGRGRFERLTGAPWDTPVPRDTAGLVGWAPGELLVAAATYEDGTTAAPIVQRLNRTNTLPLLSTSAGSVGPVAVADYDGDGALDVFVGTRVVRSQYPVPAPSGLYRMQAGALVADKTNAAVLPEALVSSALWTDLTGDGWPELVLACDWGPLRVFRNNHGQLSEWKVPVRLAASNQSTVGGPGAPAVPQPTLNSQLSTLDSLPHLTGWWNGVAAGDFDNDGRLDLVAANWGGNTRYERWRSAPLRFYYGDFNEDGVIEMFESHWVPELRGYAPDRMLDAVTRVLPRLGERFPTHEAWAGATMEAVLGEWQTSARSIEVGWLESTLFLNRGDHFEVHVLPTEAQLTPAFAVCVADADGDGNEDVFLSQNFFGVELDTSRYDAGRGLWLRGDGHGGLTPVRGQDCGVLVYGEQRGAAVADFDADGRVDLVVTQNSAETKLYRNAGAKPGLRVRLEGPTGNPFGIGAVLWLRYGNRTGPAREVRAGSGYWSQDSPVQVLGLGEVPRAIEVRWPGGRVTTSALPAGARAVRVRAGGESEVIE
jgi:hypothetical protein